MNESHFFLTLREQQSVSDDRHVLIKHGSSRTNSILLKAARTVTESSLSQPRLLLKGQSWMFIVLTHTSLWFW